MQGSARVADSEARSPELEIRNQGRLPVKYLEIGWLVQNHDGEEFFAGTVPADVNLAPGAVTKVQQDAVLKLTQRNGSPVPITGMTGFVNHVEFADGSMWIPPRQSLDLDRLSGVEAAWLLPGHGPAWTGGVPEAVAEVRRTVAAA